MSGNGKRSIDTVAGDEYRCTKCAHTWGKQSRWASASWKERPGIAPQMNIEREIPANSNPSETEFCFSPWQVLQLSDSWAHYARSGGTNSVPLENKSQLRLGGNHIFFYFLCKELQTLSRVYQQPAPVQVKWIPAARIHSDNPSRIHQENLLARRQNNVPSERQSEEVQAETAIVIFPPSFSKSWYRMKSNTALLSRRSSCSIMPITHNNYQKIVVYTFSFRGFLFVIP